MLPQFDRDVFDISPDKIAKVDNLHIPDLPMLHFPQNLTQNKKIQLSCYLSCNPKILRAIPPLFGEKAAWVHEAHDTKQFNLVYVIIGLTHYEKQTHVFDAKSLQQFHPYIFADSA